METDRDKFILDNIPLIHKVIKDLHIYYETEDEYQEYYDYGLEGLIIAADKYDSSKYKPSTFFYKCIKNMVLRLVYKKKLAKNKNEFGKDISLNKIIANEGENELLLGDILEDHNINIEEQIEKKLEIEKLLMAVNKLKNEKDKLVIKMYYGIDGFVPIKMSEIAIKMGVTKTMVWTRITRARRKLREYLEKNDKEVFMVEQKNIYAPENNINKRTKKLTTLNDLNSILFQQIEALNNENSDFEKEIRKSYAISQISQQIVANTNTCIKAMKLAKEHKIENNNQLEFIGLTYEK